MHIPALVLDFIVSGTATGFVGGAALAFFSKQVKADIVRLWHWLCAVGHRFHIKQTTMDDRAIELLDRARPAIDAAMDQARAGLVVERATAAALEADQTPQSGSLMPTPIESAPLAAPVIAAAVDVAQPVATPVLAGAT